MLNKPSWHRLFLVDALHVQLEPQGYSTTSGDEDFGYVLVNEGKLQRRSGEIVLVPSFEGPEWHFLQAMFLIPLGSDSMNQI